MGVRIILSKTYKTLVKFTVLGPDGKEEAMSYTAEFERLTRDEVKELVETGNNDAEMLKRVLRGWSLKDLGSNEEVPFTPENFEAVLNIAGFAGVSMLRFMETVGANRGKS